MSIMNNGSISIDSPVVSASLTTVFSSHSEFNINSAPSWKRLKSISKGFTLFFVRTIGEDNKHDQSTVRSVGVLVHESILSGERDDLQEFNAGSFLSSAEASYVEFMTINIETERNQRVQWQLMRLSPSFFPLSAVRDTSASMRVFQVEDILYDRQFK